MRMDQTGVWATFGFGKTEVAMRAAFIAQAYQVANKSPILVPTTLSGAAALSKLLRSFRTRPFKIEVISRYLVVQKEQKIVIDEPLLVAR